MKFLFILKHSYSFSFVLIITWLLPNEGLSESVCRDNEIMGVIHQTHYSQQLMKDDGPDIVTDSTTYHLPEASYKEELGNKYVMSLSVGGALSWKKEQVKLYEWSMPLHVYSYNKVSGLAFVREKTTANITGRPVALTSHKKKELSKHAGIDCVRNVVNTSSGKIETCSIAIFGKPVDIYATIESTRTKLVTLELKEGCFSKNLHVVPDLNWK